MQQKKALELRKQWGDRPCDHPTLEKEYELGSATGDYVCTTCGESRSGGTWNNNREEGQNP